MTPPGADLNPESRKLDLSDLMRVGDTALREHLHAQAVVARKTHGPLFFENLEALLSDPACLRYPTRLVFEFGEMASHQFAQPGIDPRDPDQHRRVLYLRPLLRPQPALVVLAVAYMIPAINYGDVITDDHCLLYGATLLELTEEEFYRRICDLADRVGAVASPDVGPRSPEGSAACQ